jgi:hypothetical protein
MACLTHEAFEWDNDEDRFHYNPQVSPLTLQHLQQAHRFLNMAIDSVDYGTGEEMPSRGD